MQIPLIDASLYLPRYCTQLKLGEKAQIVAKTATKIMQSMKRDWISTGRRPQGLCGCAILIATRYHGLDCSIYDVSKVVKSSAEIIKERMKEFGNTDCAKLTQEEFEAIDSQSWV